MPALEDTRAIPVAKLLIVDDQATQMKALHQTLEAEGYSPVGFTSAGAALAALRKETFDLVLADLKMPEMDGVTFLRAAFDIDPTVAGIVMTGYGTVDTAIQAMRVGALDYVVKPFRLSTILPALTRSLAVRRARMENIESHQAVGMCELSRTLGLAFYPETVVGKIADAAAAQSRVCGVSVLLPGGPDSNELRVAAARGVNVAGTDETRIPFGEEPSRWFARARERQLANEGAGLECALSAPLKRVPGTISVAMLAGGHFKGILRFSFEHPERPVSPGQMKALNILASEAAAALESASLLNQAQTAERQYRRLSENTAEMVFCYDLQPAPRLTYVNKAVGPITGFSPEEYYEDQDLAVKIAHPEDRTVMKTALAGGYPSGSTVSLRCLHKNGKTVWIEQRVLHVRDQDGRLAGVEAIARDVTDRKALEERLQEGKMGLRRWLGGKEMPELLSRLDFGEYIELLSRRVFDGYCAAGPRVRLEVNAEAIDITAEQAVLSGLVVVELLSNSLQHAFRDGREGLIRISLRRREDEYIEFEVVDDGIGMPADFRLEDWRSPGLDGGRVSGFEAVRVWVSELGADFSAAHEDGTAFRFGWKAA